MFEQAFNKTNVLDDDDNIERVFFSSENESKDINIQCESYLASVTLGVRAHLNF